MGNPEDPEFQRQQEQAEMFAKWRRPDGTGFQIPSVERTWGLIISAAIFVFAIAIIVSIVRF